MTRNIDVIKRYLADLPDLVTPDLLAPKLGLTAKAIYQRLWLQKKEPSNNQNMLPPRFEVPGSDRVYFERSEVIEWWLTSREKNSVNNKKTADTSRRGRPKIAEKLAANHLLTGER